METLTPLGAIDLGSHTVRLLIARWDGQEWVPFLRERFTTRLAGGFESTGSLSPDAMDRTFSALMECQRRLKVLGVRHVVCGATGVLRRASNAADFLRRINEELDLPVKVLSQEEEARLSALGMLSVVDDGYRPILCFDLGGGTTEFVLLTSPEFGPSWVSSLPVGAVTLTEKTLATAPTSEEDVAKAREKVRRRLDPVRRAIDVCLCRFSLPCPNGQRMTDDTLVHELQSEPTTRKGLRVIGTAGTVTTLAAVFLGMEKYDPCQVNGLDLHRDWLRGLIRWLAGRTLEERSRLRGLESGRQDIILGGAVIVLEIMDLAGVSKIKVADSGLLEGLLVDLVRELEREKGRGPKTF